MPYLPVTRIVATVLLSLQLAACYVWRDVRSVQPAQYLADHSPTHVRLTIARSAAMGTLRSSRIELLRPELARDSIRGPRARHLPGDPAHPRPGDVATIALADVSRLEVRRIEPVRTTLAVGVLAYVVAGFVWLATWDGPMGASR